MSLTTYFPWTTQGLDDAPDFDTFEFRVSSAGKRVIVFFDECIPAYVVYKGNRTRNTSVDIEVNVIPKDILENEGVHNLFLEDIGTRSGAENGADSKETATFAGGTFETLSTKASGTDLVFNEDRDDNTVVLVWKVILPLSYPKRRLHNPKAVVSCFFSPFDLPTSGSHESTPALQPATSTLLYEEVVLKDYAPAEGNLLSELAVPFPGNDHHESLTLLQTNVLQPERSNSPEESTTNTFRLEDHQKVTCRSNTSIDICTPAVIRLKSTKPAGRNECLLATLSVDISDTLVRLMQEWDEDYVFEIESLKVTFNSGAMENLDSVQLPVQLEASESINFTHRLVCDDHLNAESRSDRTLVKPVNFRVSIRVLKRIGDKTSKRAIPFTTSITTNWTPYLDFGVIAPPTNNSLKTSISTQVSPQFQTPNLSNVVMTPHLTGTPSFPRSNVRKIMTPNTNAMGSGAFRLPSQPFFTQKKTNRSVIAPLNSLPITVNLTTNANSALSGLKLIFEGRFNLRLGEVAKWKVKAMNNSSTRMSLSLIMQNPINFNPVYANPGLQINNNFLSSNLLSNTKTTGDILVYNKADLQSQYSALQLQQHGVIVLNNDIRIGPLDPNSVFETELAMLGISRGVYNLAGLKIFEISSGDGLDFGKLVEVFVI